MMMKIFILLLVTIVVQTANANIRLTETQKLYNEIGLTEVMPYELFKKG